MPPRRSSLRARYRESYDSRYKNNFAVGGIFDNGSVGFGRFFQGKFLSNDRSKRSVLQPGVERSMDALDFRFGRVEQGHSEDGSIAAHGITRINFSLAAAADHHHAAVLCQKYEIFPKIYVGQHFEDEIDSFLVGESQKLVRIVRCLMIKDVM